MASQLPDEGSRQLEPHAEHTRAIGSTHAELNPEAVPGPSTLMHSIEGEEVLREVRPASKQLLAAETNFGLR
jgi:hypothetical protein